MQQDTREPVRLVIWDLDGTFWDGTLTEGGHTYRRDIHDIVVSLTQRGIVSSICSKNDFARVKAILEAEGIWDYFVLPSIDWEAKGPRLAALVEAIGLRPPTVLFIDDNHANRAEATHAVPGLQVADETCIGALLDDPLLRGKPDPELTRLRQYRLLEQRRAAQRESRGDNLAFLRASDIRVSIDHDVEKHIDRAVELINRTNQLNFTKLRLPEDPAQARDALRESLASFRMQAGLIRVRDRYGDHGYCGFYALNNGLEAKALTHFCFSCRILNMGVEAWAYQLLGRPRLRVQGEVLSDPVRAAPVDWITLDAPGLADTQTEQSKFRVDHVYARGACELNAVTHYLGMVADNLVVEFDTIRDGRRMLWQHSMFARHAIEGLSEAGLRAASLLGYTSNDFRSVLQHTHEQTGSAVWLLSFVADASGKLYRHRETGLQFPIMLSLTSDEDQMAAPELASAFEQIGTTPEDDFKQNLRLILQRAPAQGRVFILMPKEGHRTPAGKFWVNRSRTALNHWTREIAAEFGNVALLPVVDFCAPEERETPGTHYDRMTYFRIYERIMRDVAG
jgi:FkbH-like protein